MNMYIHQNMAVNLIFICSEFWTQFFQKETNVSANVEPVWLDFLVVSVTAMVGMQIFWFPIKFVFSLWKNEQVSNEKQ